MKQRPHVEIVGLDTDIGHPADSQLDLALTQVTQEQLCRLHFQVEHHARIKRYQPIEYSGGDRRHWRRCAEPQLAGRRVRQRGDLTHALPQFIEHDDAAFE